MANTSHLFHSDDADKQTLHRRITPSEDQQKTQQDRWGDLADYLKDSLSEKTGYPVSSWLQGSYKLRTQTRPVKIGKTFDIDLGIYFEWGADSDGTDPGPKKLKEIVQGALHEYGSELEEDVMVLEPPKKRCCRIVFQDDFHIDVPTYHLDRAKDERCPPSAFVRQVEGFSYWRDSGSS